METWDWIEKDGLKYFVAERGTKRKNRVTLSVHDMVEATINEDYSELKVKYMLSDEDISILKMALRTGRWKVSVKASFN